jgi:hypothetical protein
VSREWNSGDNLVIPNRFIQLICCLFSLYFLPEDSEDQDGDIAVAGSTTWTRLVRMKFAIPLFGRHLRSVRLVKWPRTERDHELFYDLIGKCPNIVHLGADITASDTLSVWSALPQLSRLDLGSYDLSADEIDWSRDIADWKMQGGGNLKELYLPLQCDDYVPEFYQALLDVACQTGQLTTLQCVIDNDETFKTISSVRSLAHIRLALQNGNWSVLRPVNDCLVPLLQSHGQELRSLIIDASVCEDVERDTATAVVLAIANTCRKLECLELNCNISNEFVHAFNSGHVLKFLRETPTLTNLGLGYCAALEDRYLACMLECCRNLQNLRLTGCNGYDEEEDILPRTIIGLCPNLRSLTLKGRATGFDHSDFELAATELRFLQKLDVDYESRGTALGRAKEEVREVRAKLGLEPVKIVVPWFGLSRRNTGPPTGGVRPVMRK